MPWISTWRRKTHTTALFSSLHSRMPAKRNSVLPYSSSLCLYLPNSSLSTLYSCLPPLSSSISSPFQSLLPHSFFSPSPITVKLQGGWLGTFLTEKFGSDLNHYRAFLHSFPNLNDFAAAQTHPPRQPDTLTLTICKSPALSFSVIHIRTYKYKPQLTPTSCVTAHVPASRLLRWH